MGPPGLAIIDTLAAVDAGDRAGQRPLEAIEKMQQITVRLTCPGHLGGFPANPLEGFAGGRINSALRHPLNTLDIPLPLGQFIDMVFLLAVISQIQPHQAGRITPEAKDEITLRGQTQGPTVQCDFGIRTGLAHHQTAGGNLTVQRFQQTAFPFRRGRQRQQRTTYKEKGLPHPAAPHPVSF